VSLFFSFLVLQIHFEAKYQFKSSWKWPNSALLASSGLAASFALLGGLFLAALRAVRFPGFNFLPYRPLVSNIFSIYGRGFL
jgi:hypothetical protein